MIKKYKQFTLLLLIAVVILVIFDVITTTKIKQTIKRIDAPEEKIDAYGIVFDREGEKVK